MANEKNINSRIQHKHDTETNWLKAINFIPKVGELIIYDPDNNYTYSRFKIGDGKTLVNNLPFAVEETARNDVYYIATDYGVIPNPEADNTLAMQNLINTVYENGGGIIWLPIGTYGFDRNSENCTTMDDGFRRCLEPKSGVSIVGESLTETIIRVYGTNSDTPWIANYTDEQSTEVALSGFAYQNFTVDMSDAYLVEGEYSSSGKAFDMKAIKNCIFRDLRILHSPATGFGIDMLDNVVIDSLYLYNCGKQWEYGKPGGAGIGIGTGRWEMENFIIRNCICAGCGHFGIFLEDQGIFNETPVKNYTMGQIITNNVVRNGRHYGIGIRGGQNVVITGNNVYRNKGGIYLDYGAQRVMVSNNAISENTEIGLLFGIEDADTRDGFNGFACENISISGNSFLVNQFGILIEREPLNSKIENNIFINNNADTLSKIPIDESKIKQGVYINDAGEIGAHEPSWLYDEFIDMDTTIITYEGGDESPSPGAYNCPRIAMYDKNHNFLKRINPACKANEIRDVIEAALEEAGISESYRYIKFGDNCEGEILTTMKLYSIIDEIAFNRASNIHYYATCDTAAATAAKIATIQNGAFTLETGVKVSVKFTYANNVADATLNINSSGAKAIRYRNTNLKPDQYWVATQVVDFVYDGTDWQVIGTIMDNNTTYAEATTSVKGLMSASDKTKLEQYPIVTTSDNGKFLRVVEGVWAASVVPIAEEATF